MVNPEKAVLEALIAVAHKEATGPKTKLARDRVDQHIQKYQEAVQFQFGGVPDAIQALVAEVISDAAAGPIDLVKYATWRRANELFCNGLEAADLAEGSDLRELRLGQRLAAKAAMNRLLEAWKKERKN